MGAIPGDAARQFSFCRPHQDTQFLKEEMLYLGKLFPLKRLQIWKGPENQKKKKSKMFLFVKLTKNMEVHLFWKPFGRVRNKLQVYICRCKGRKFQ